MASNDLSTTTNSPTSSLPIDTTQNHTINNIAGSDAMRLSHSPEETTTDRRLSREWDASKVPPSQFQRPKGSIYSTPGTRDGHVQGSERYQAYWQKLKEKGWNK